MWPCVLNSAREGDCRPLGQGGGTEIDLVVGQLSAHAGIKGAVVLGLRESETRRGQCARKHAGECASSDVHGYSSLSKLCFGLSNRYLGTCTSQRIAPSIAPIPRIRHNGRPLWRKKESGHGEVSKSPPLPARHDSAWCGQRCVRYTGRSECQRAAIPY